MKMNVSSDNTKEFLFNTLRVIGLFSPEDKSISDTEADLLARFMALPDTHRFYPFSYKARKLVSESYTPKMTKQNLSLKVNSLISKGYLYRDEDNFIDYTPTIKKLLNIKEFNVTLLNRAAD
jgi:hypothetical protein